MKVSRSLKLMRGAPIRTRKLARDMLLFWKRVDKEMVCLCFFAEALRALVSQQLAFSYVHFFGVFSIVIKNLLVSISKQSI